MAEVIGAISAVITLIDTSIQFYDSAQKDIKLSETFEVVRRRLPVIRQTLATCKNNLAPQEESIPGDVKNLEEIFEKIIYGPSDTRHERYLKALRRLGKGNKVEELMLSLTKDVQLIVNHDTVMSTNQHQNAGLENIISEMKSATSSVPDENTSTKTFDSGGGAQTNNVNSGRGKQYNSVPQNFGYINNYSCVPVGMSGIGAEDRVFQVHKWLSPANVKDDFFNHQKEYMDGSCDWALRDVELESFLASETETGALRIGGAPGSGKSILTAFIISCLLKAADAHVLYFFCKDTDESKRQPYQVLRTLLSQLLALDGGYLPFSWVDNLRLQSGKKHAESFAILHEAFQHILANRSTDRRLYIVVDALDECVDGCHLISSLTTSSYTSKSTFKLLLTCREEPDLINASHRYQEQSRSPLRELIVLPSLVQQPIATYIKQRVSECQHINSTALGQQVFTEICAAADGSWLYARLMLDEIERLPSAALVTRQLRNIPNSLMELYQTIFVAMGKAVTQLELRLAQQLFLWIDMVDFVLVGKAALDRQILDVVFQAANSGEEVFDSVALARKLCSPLITIKEVVGGRNDIWEECQHRQLEIIFVHHTAAQFVRLSANREGNQAAAPVPTILELQALKELHRANTAAWYFGSCNKSKLLLNHLRSDASEGFATLGVYFEMNYGLWNAFFLDTLPGCLGNDGLAQASFLCSRLTGFLLSTQCLTWVEMAIIINYQGGFINLFENAIHALAAANNSTRITYRDNKSKLLPAFQSFSVARKCFFADYVSVISRTGPAWDGKIAMPEGFESRPLAKSLLSLGQKWMHYFDELDPDV